LSLVSNFNTIFKYKADVERFVIYFSSSELKVQVSFFDCSLSVVRSSVNFYIFDFFSRITGPTLTRLGTSHPWGEGIQNILNEGQRPYPRGDNSKIVQIHLISFKYSPEPAGQFKFGTNHPCVKGIRNFSNKGPGHLQRGDNHKNAKTRWGHLKIFFLRTLLKNY
jgi:hypothetical protein